MTDVDDLEVEEIINDFYKENPVIRTEFNFENIKIFLLNNLKFLNKKHETVRPLQTYWTVNPLLKIQKLQQQEVFDQNGELILQIKKSLSMDFKQRQYHDPHMMAAYGTVLGMHQLNYMFTEKDQQYAIQMLLQLNNNKTGGFRANPEGETDVRVTYAAVVVATVMGLFENHGEICKQLFKNTVKYIKSKQSPQGGFGSNSPEPHAAYTYCALAGLKLLCDAGFDVENAILNQQEIETHLNYLLNRQTRYGGFNGRPNKHVDGCYSFWCLGSIHLLNPAYLKLVDTQQFDKFVLNCCQDEEGHGLRDKPDVYPDAYHTNYVLMGYCILHGLMEKVELGY